MEVTKKKCLNCLCMVDFKASVCPYCKSSLRIGRFDSVKDKNFKPPTVIQEQLRQTTIKAPVHKENSGSFLEIEPEISENPENLQSEIQIKEDSQEANQESREEKTAAEKTYSRPVDRIIAKISERLNQEWPFARLEFDFDSLEIAEIIDKEEKKEYKLESADKISVSAEKLNELNELASMFSDTDTTKQEKTEVKEEKKEDKIKSFESRNILRVSDKEIKETKEAEPPPLNIMDIINVLEDIEKEKTAEAESDDSEKSSPKADSELTEPVQENQGEKVPDNHNESDNNVTLEFLDLKLLYSESETIKASDRESEQSSLKEIANNLILDERNLKNEQPEKEELGLVLYQEKEEENQEEDTVNTKNLSNKNVVLTKKSSGARASENQEAVNHFETAKKLCVDGNYQKALEELELSVKKDPAYELAHILLSRTYLKLKNG